MPHEISTGSHWPRPAAIAAVAAVATGAIDGAALRLADRWYRHLAERRVAVPRERDFAAFGGVSKLERLRRALAPIAPRDLPPILPALNAKRSETWRKTKAATAAKAAAGTPAPRPRGPAPELSAPLGDLPKSWLRALHEMRSLRKTLDTGRLSLDDRTPPSAKVIRNLESTLRILAGDCLRQGLPVGLTVETFTLWRAARLSPWTDKAGKRRAPNRHITIASRCKELALFAAWCEMDETLIHEIHERRRRHDRAGKGARKRKEEWMLANDVGIGDVWVRAEELLEAAEAAPPASDLRVQLTLDAVCLALSIVAPLRIGDLHRLRVGEHLQRHTDGWSLSILTGKTGALYERPRLWPELTPFLDAVILLTAPGGDFWAGYDARSTPSTAVFSQDFGKTGAASSGPPRSGRGSSASARTSSAASGIR